MHDIFYETYNKSMKNWLFFPQGCVQMISHSARQMRNPACARPFILFIPSCEYNHHVAKQREMGYSVWVTKYFPGVGKSVGADLNQEAWVSLSNACSSWSVPLVSQLHLNRVRREHECWGMFQVLGNVHVMEVVEVGQGHWRTQGRCKELCS